MDGPQILVESLSTSHPKGEASWQYHPRSDHHSKVACWGVLFDLLQSSALLREHVAQGKVVFGVNHTIRDFAHDRKKDLDLVIGRPADGAARSSHPRTFADLVDRYTIRLSRQQESILAGLPVAYEGEIGAALMALEAKAAMTEHSKARPRLFDELNSSHLTVHGASDQTLAVGLAVVNASPTFISPTRHPPTARAHKQPKAMMGVIDKLRSLPRRSGTMQTGFDGFAIVVVSMVNDGSPVQLVTAPPAPQPGGIFEYTSAITRVATEYDSTFRRI